ncbi:protein kinase [Paludisphaera sp.]|uniref:protein kinase domain-containing protein n=1 Tax=Paludisphaera sp. TaxID=2017432 RepID=UPI00301CD924
MEPQVPTPPCLDDDVLRAFALGDLPEAGIEAVRRHLDSCARCESRAEALDRHTDHVLDELRRSLAGRAPGRDAAGPLDREPPILADYVVEGPPIGVGGTGLIYKARHVKLGRPAALKMVARRPDVVARLFEIEARAVAQLQHPYIVQIYDIGTHGDRPFLALELVDGGSLADRMTGEPWPPRAAAETILIVAEAVDHAHRHGIIHCDLKPSNILMTRDGVPKIADFGVAKWTESDAHWGEEGGRRGTPRYMAPEQAGGPGEVGPATDVYTLGVILHEMLAGRVPQELDGASATRRDAVSLPPSRVAPGVPRELDRVALRCLRGRPEDRYPGARELAEDLRRFLDGPAEGGRWGAARPAALAASAAATVLVAWLASDPSLVAAVRVAATRDAAGFSPRSTWDDPDLTIRTVIQADGSIRLGAASAVVSGSSLKFEGSFGNLGYWHEGDDRASWSFLVEPEAAGRYHLCLEYANSNGDAGNRYEIRLDGSAHERVAEGTGGWTDYRVFPVAEVDLNPGVHTIEIRPADPPRGALFDLRAVVLASAGG